MKKILFLILAISFLLLPGLKAGDTDLEKLKAENEAAIKKVIDRYETNLRIIDRAYLKKLLELKKFFIKKGDLNGAVAVRDEINAFKEKLGVPDKKDPPKEEKVEDNSKDDDTETSTDGDDENTDDDGGNDGDDNSGDDSKVHGEEEF